MLMRTRESCGFEGPKRFTMALPVKFGGLEKTERLTGLVYVYEQLWPVATGIDNGPVFSDLCSPLAAALGQEASPSPTHNVAHSYHHHLIMHLAHEVKVVSTKNPKVKARPSPAGYRLL